MTRNQVRRFHVLEDPLIHVPGFCIAVDKCLDYFVFCQIQRVRSIWKEASGWMPPAANMQTG